MRIAASANVMSTAAVPTRNRRRGIATYWIMGLVPAAFGLLVLVTDYGNIWLAREELENAVEAGALAGAKQWGDLSNLGANGVTARTLAHNYAAQFAMANTVLGQVITVDPNDDAGAGPLANNNDDCGGDVLLGRITGTVFEPNIVPTAAFPDASDRACQVTATASVNTLWTALGLGPYTVRATATARYEGSEGGGTPRLVRVTSQTCP